MRLKYYEDKRKAHTRQVEETIRSGVIEDVKSEFPPTLKNPTAMNRTSNSVGRSTHIFGTMQSPKTSLAKHGMNMVADYGINMPQSMLPPDIILRDPLDQEFVLNRKMAKKYYESQLQQRMSDNKLKNLEGREKRYKDLHDVEHKKEKAI